MLAAPTSPISAALNHLSDPNSHSSTAPRRILAAPPPFLFPLRLAGSAAKSPRNRNSYSALFNIYGNRRLSLRQQGLTASLLFFPFPSVFHLPPPQIRIRSRRSGRQKSICFNLMWLCLDAWLPRALCVYLIRLRLCGGKFLRKQGLISSPDEADGGEEGSRRQWHFKKSIMQNPPVDLMSKVSKKYK